MGLEVPATDQASVFRRLRLRLARNGLRVAMESGRARLITLIATSIVVSLFAFAVTYFGFRQLTNDNVPLKGLIVESLFDLLFFTLGGMLLFSTGIILYASLFTSPEAKYLLTTPARADRIFATKFQGAVAFSSWGFVILGLPIFVAYGVVSGVPWYFYALLPVFLLGYVLLPGSVSAALCLLLMRYMPRNRKQFFRIVGVIAIVLVGVWIWRVQIAAKQTLVHGGKELDNLIGQFDLARSGLTPSHWMTRGVMAAARGDFSGALLPLALVWSNGLLLYVIAAGIAGRTYRTAFDRLAGGGRGKKVYGTSVLDRAMAALVFYLPRPTRILVVKDFRTFRRDPTQWALLAIFGALILAGAGNFRQAFGANLERLDKYVISLMFLCGVAVLVCAGLSRFIFPLMSLEGRKFWILGLTPVNRGQILWGKFAFAATGSVLFTQVVILTSDVLLGLPPTGVVLHALAVFVLALGLSALNVGLGAYLPNFRETDPSKIVVGFGGTVNMVIGLGFLVVVIGLMVVPYHVTSLAKDRVAVGSAWVYAGVPLGLLAGVLAVWLPLRAGRRALERVEF